MKTAQELRVGNGHGRQDPLVVQKAEYNKSGRNAAVVKLKFKNLLTGAASESVTRPTKSSKSSNWNARSAPTLLGDPMYVFMDEEYNQYEIEADSMGDALNYLEESMPASATRSKSTPARTSTAAASTTDPGRSEKPDLRSGFLPVVRG